MIGPDHPAAHALLLLTLVALAALLGWRAARKGRHEYRRFKQFRSSARRQRMYRKWLIDAFVVYGGASAALLLLVGPYVPLLQERTAAVDWIGVPKEWFAASGALGPVIAIAVVAVLVAVNVLAIIALRDTDTIPAAGDILALLPRNRSELGYGAALSVNAGVVEELLFRVALPSLLFGITGDATLSVVLAVIAFGGLHVYQGVAGVLTSTVIGAMLMGVYLVTGSIVAAIVLHVLIDLRSLVLIPVIVNRVHQRPGTYSAPARPASVDTPT